MALRPGEWFGRYFTSGAERTIAHPVPYRAYLANNRGVVRVGHGIDCEHRYRFVPQNCKTSVLLSVNVSVIYANFNHGFGGGFGSGFISGRLVLGLNCKFFNHLLSNGCRYCNCCRTPRGTDKTLLFFVRVRYNSHRGYNGESICCIERELVLRILHYHYKLIYSRVIHI